jgi:hypothetical protein
MKQFQQTREAALNGLLATGAAAGIENAPARSMH